MKNYNEYTTERGLNVNVNLLVESLFDSTTLFKEMALLNPRAVSKAQTAFQFIHQYKIPGVLIGGMAVSHYVADRPLTPDVDFLISNLPEVENLLKQEKIMYRNLASDGSYGGIQVPQYDADFLDANQGNVNLNHYAIKTAVRANIGGVPFPVIDPSVLCIMKFNLGRNKDTEDAFKLLKVVDKKAFKEHLKALKNDLKGDLDAKTIWSYAQGVP